MFLAEATEQTIKECIEEGVLADFLRLHRAEVLNVYLLGFNQEAYERDIREEGIQLAKQVFFLYGKGTPVDIIALEVGISIEEVENILSE